MKHVQTSLIYFFIFFISILKINGLRAFKSIWVGESFRESSFQSINQSEQLSRVCGYQKLSKTKEFPWAVSFTVDGVNRLGGSIISPFHILTVAHGFIKTIGVHGNLCLSDDGKEANSSIYRSIELIRKTRKVAYGGRCIRGHSKNLPNDEKCKKPDVVYNRIRSILIDGDFAANSCIRGHDWAIVEVETRIEFNDDVMPICLPPKRMRFPDVLSVAGWGRRNIFNESGPLIHDIPMRIDPTCRRPWSDILPADAEDYMCAKSLNINDYYAPRTCHGDSGGGMEYRDDFDRTFLVAMTSFGTKGCPPNMLARFTRVENYLELICKYTGVCYTSTE